MVVTAMTPFVLRKQRQRVVQHYIVSVMATSGTNRAADFSQTNNCPVGGTLAAGASCNIKASFKPSASGTESVKIVINDSAANSPQTVYLSCTGR